MHSLIFIHEQVVEVKLLYLEIRTTLLVATKGKY
jgi:hypothetical protein